MSYCLNRTAEVTATDDTRSGYWLVEAFGTAGRWFACSRSLETAVALATYASMIGESPRDEWTCESDDAPYALDYSSASAEETFARNERVWRAQLRGNLLDDAPLADPTDEQWRALDTGAAVPLGDGRMIVLSNIGCAHIITPEREYVETDGTIIIAHAPTSVAS